MTLVVFSLDKGVGERPQTSFQIEIWYFVTERNQIERRKENNKPGKRIKVRIVHVRKKTKKKVELRRIDYD